MGKLNSITYKESGFNIAQLILRLFFGAALIVNHGMHKLMHFSDLSNTFFDPFHIGHQWSLLLVVFAEVFCALFIILGLFTRIATIPPIIAMAVATFMANGGRPFSDQESAISFLVAFLVILITGPGKISVDGMMK